MPTPPRWLWRFIFAAAWLAATLWWLPLPLATRYKHVAHLPFGSLIAYRSESALIISPIPPSYDDFEHTGLVASREVGEQFEQEYYAERREALFQDYLKKGHDLRWSTHAADYWIRPPRKPQSIYGDIGYSARTREIQRIRDLQEKRLRRGGWKRQFGTVRAWRPPVQTPAQQQRAAQLLAAGITLPPNVLPSVQPIYIANPILYAIAALSLLPLLTGAARWIRWRTTTPARAPTSEPPAAAAPRPHKPDRHGLLRPPRWLWRIALALSAIAAAAFIRAGPLLLPYEGLSLLTFGTTGCIVFHRDALLIGASPDPADAEAAVQAALLSNAVMLSTKLTDILEFRRTVRRSCSLTGLGFPSHGPYAAFAITGWPVALFAAILTLPLLFALRTTRIIAARRRANRCTHCNYPLHGLPEPRCPECGLTAASHAAPRTVQSLP